MADLNPETFVPALLADMQEDLADIQKELDGVKMRTDRLGDRHELGRQGCEDPW